MKKEIDDMELICDILSASKTIAVVGISRSPNKTSRSIAEFLVNKGYHVVGVNPYFDEADSTGDIKVYRNLSDIPFDVDIVDVFRRSEDIPELISDVLNKKPKTLWLQQDIRNDEAVQPVIENGINTIQDKCIAVFYNLCRVNRKK